MAREMDIWAVVEHDKPLEKVKQTRPEPKGTEVLVKVTHCGVCHSDLHFQEGYYELDGGKKMHIKDRGATLPRAVGHEILGVVEEFGPDAKGVTKGDSRICFPWLGCGNCWRCGRNEDTLCAKQRSLGVFQHGGFAEYVLLPHPKYLVEYGDVDPALACTFACSGITTLNAVQKVMPMPPDQPIVLIGAGGLGLAAISMLKSFGHENIISVDVREDQLEAAKKAGATKTVNSSKGNPVEAIIEAAGGPVLACIDFVNNPKTGPVAMGILGKGGKWIFVGVMGGSMEIPIFKALTIYGNLTGEASHLREVSSLAQQGKLPPIPITKMSWDKANEAMDLLREGKVNGRLILVKD
jgi:alcohol dehydrogenase, propanol-preferring